MATLLQRGLSFAARALPAAAGGRIEVRRGGDRVEMPCAFGLSRSPVDDGRGGVRIEHSDLDCIVAAADYLLAGTAALPENGDLITILSDGPRWGETFEVAAIPGELCYRSSDPLGAILRLHCKKVK